MPLRLEEGLDNGKGKALSGHGQGQATSSEQGQEQAAMTSTEKARLPIPKIEDSLLPYWNPYVEHCGLVLSDHTTIEIRNSARGTGGEFLMMGEDVCDALVPHGMDVEDIVGIFHTHPSNCSHPSIPDIKGWPKGSIRYFIVTQNKVVEWELNDDGRTVSLVE